MSKSELAEKIFTLVNNISDENKKRNKPNLPAVNYSSRIFEDNHFSVFQTLPDCIVVYSRDFDQTLLFQIESQKTPIITDEGISMDNIDDVTVTINGEKMIFDGAYI